MTTREVGVVTPMSELCLIVSDARTQQAYLDTVEGEMITVNIWPGIPQGNWGHASALIEDTYYAHRTRGICQLVAGWRRLNVGLSFG